MMLNNKRWYRLSVQAVALLLALLVSSLLALNAGASPARQTGSETDQLKPLSGKDFEIAFMSAMIQHHQGALDMAKLVPDRANHAELKTTAQQIIADQTREINEMTGWLQQWYSTTPQHNMGNMNMGMGNMAKLESLKGAAFDQEFLTEMRMHHQSAIAMAQLIPDRATHAELKTLGQNIIRSQTAEIQQFESWLKSWYNVDVTGSGMTSGGTMSGGAMGSSMPPTGGGPADFSWIFLLAAFSILAGALLVRNNRRRTRV